jgi:hypothetical protein
MNLSDDRVHETEQPAGPPAGEGAPGEISDREILERLAKWVVIRRLTVPSILFLETHRPLSFIGSQLMVVASPFVHFFEPFLKGLVGEGYEHKLYNRFADLLADRENVERLVIEIERQNQDQKARESEEKRHRKELKRALREQKRALRRSRRDSASSGARNG